MSHLGSSLIILATYISLSSYAVEINSNNLKALLEQKNSRISASQFQILAAKEREGVLARSFFPRVKLQASQESFKTGIDSYRTQPTYGLEGTLNLYNGGQDSLESDIRKLNSELQTVQAQQVVTRELQNLRTTYWEILYLRNKKILLKEALETNKSNTSGALRRIRSGVATDTDRLEFEMEGVNLQREYDQVEIQINNNLSILQAILNLDSKDGINFNEELEHEHEVNSMLSPDPKNFEFMYKDLELNSQISAMHSDQKTRDLWPKIDAFGSYSQYNQREKDFLSSTDRDEYAVGLRITIDIPAGMESNRDAATYNLFAKATEALASIQKREVEVHLKNEIAELSFLHDQVHNADENIKRADQYYRSTQSEYNRGVKNSPDVLVASQRLFEMKHKRLQIVRDFQISKGHVLAQMGK